MQKHPTHKNTAGFTLIELVIAVAIIGILTSVAILGYNQYKVRAYDAHSKQALRDILLQCNAFWLDHDTSQVCNHATVAEVYVASDEIVLKFAAEDRPDLPDLPGSHGNFCASAQHVSSPNPYSIDSASLISDTEDCGVAGGSVQTASAGGSVQTASASSAARKAFENYQTPCADYLSQGLEVWQDDNDPGKGFWAVVDQDGKQVPPLVAHPSHRPPEWRHSGFFSCLCHACDPASPHPVNTNPPWHENARNNSFYTTEQFGKIFYSEGTVESHGHKIVFAVKQYAPGTGVINWNVSYQPEAPAIQPNMTYNFETGIWNNSKGEKFKDGVRVE